MGDKHRRSPIYYRITALQVDESGKCLKDSMLQRT